MGRMTNLQLNKKVEELLFKEQLTITISNVKFKTIAKRSYKKGSHIINNKAFCEILL